MNVVAISGERLGTLERIELDRTGQLRALIVRIATTIGASKRIFADRIHSIDDDTITVGMTPDQLQVLDDVADQDEIPV